MHTTYLLLSILFAYFWSTSPILSKYNLQLTGALVLLYFVTKIYHTTRQSRPTAGLLSSLILTVISLLLIFSTGSIQSPLFFLIDFLLFALALLFGPLQAGAVAVLIISLFSWQNHASFTPEVLIGLAQIIFITPLAIIFGKIYLANLESSGKIKILREVINEEEADSLLWISTSAKPSLSTILNSISDLVIYLNSKREGVTVIPSGLIDKLKVIQKDLIILYTSTSSFEESIKDTSDSIDLKSEK